MENASKALILAGEILLGIMLLSIGVYVFNLFGDFSQSISGEIEEAQITEFNEQFLRYYQKGYYDDDGAFIDGCTIHDVVTVVNLARQNNSYYFPEEQEEQKVQEANEGSLYIQVDFPGIPHLESKTEDELNELMKEKSINIQNIGEGLKSTEPIYFDCVECKISGENKSSKKSDDYYTRRVYYVKFAEPNPKNRKI